MTAFVSFGAWMQRRRKLLDLTRNELARRMGYSPETIKKIERDERKPSVEMAELLADHLQIPDAERQAFIQRARGTYLVDFESPTAMGVTEQAVAEPVAESEGKTAVVIPNNLPTQPTSFVGREKEIAVLDRLLKKESTRLVTILGAGGMGKTRLALTVGGNFVNTVTGDAPAGRLYEGDSLFTNGVYFVSLTPLSTADQIVPALAEALGYPLETNAAQQRTAKQQVLDYLRQKSMLLLFDNFEHLLDGAELVADILQTAVHVKMIATSRERLQLQQEQLFTLHGLDTPPNEQIDKVETFTAVQLFLQSAQRIQHDFQLHTDEKRWLIRLCHLVGGMPLAMELAAGWVEMLSLAEIVQEIQQSLDFLETGVRNVPARQRSIRAVFDGSWKQLSQTEQQILPQFAIFRGGFARHAAQTITGASLPILSKLVSKALLQYNQTERRYQIHELLRQYLAERLAQDESAENRVRSAHSRYYLNVLYGQAKKLKGREQQTALAEIEADSENIQLAWQWGIAQRDISGLTNGMDALGLFLEWNGRYREGETLFMSAVNVLAAGQSAETVTPLTRLLIWQSVFSQVVQGNQAGVALCQQSLALLDSSPFIAAKDQKQNRAFALYQIGRASNNFAQRKEALEHSLAFYRALGDHWGIVNTLQVLGEPYAWFNTFEVAEAHLQECLQLRQQMGDRRGIARTLMMLSYLARYRGQFNKALDLAEDAYKRCLENGNSVAIADALYNLANSQGHCGQFAKSIASFHDCADRFLDLGSQFWHWGSLGALGLSYLYVGDVEQARHHIHRVDRSGSHQITNIDVVLGLIYLYEGDYEQAEVDISEALNQCIQLKNEMYRGMFLNLLGLTAFYQKSHARARDFTLDGLQVAINMRHIVVMQGVYFNVVLLLAENGLLERAIQIDALVKHHHPSVEAAWIWEQLRRPFYERVASLPNNIVEAARARGRQLGYWETAESLLDELTERGWGNSSFVA